MKQSCSTPGRMPIRDCRRSIKPYVDGRVKAGRRLAARNVAQSSIQGENWHFETHSLTSAAGKSVKFYDLDRQATRTDLPTTESRLFEVSADGQIVVTTSGTNPTGAITIWDRRAVRLIDLAVPTESYSVKVFPDGGRFIVGWRDGTIRCYRSADGQVLWTMKAVDRVDTLVLSPRVHLLFTGSEGVTKVSYEIWRTDSGG